ncbi:MAG: HigA family addiction module antidote protein, partial [Ferruginibacter sp.]|nr:HigA family addiction module antidote protein [Cytophagales bacterium]
RAAISPEMALRLEQGFGVSAAFWLDLQKKYDLWQVVHSGRVAGIHRFSTPSRMPGQSPLENHLRTGKRPPPENRP